MKNKVTKMSLWDWKKEAISLWLWMCISKNNIVWDGCLTWMQAQVPTSDMPRDFSVCVFPLIQGCPFLEISTTSQISVRQMEMESGRVSVNQLV